MKPDSSTTNGYKSSLEGDGNVLKLDGSDGDTIL